MVLSKIDKIWRDNWKYLRFMMSDRPINFHMNLSWLQNYYILFHSLFFTGMDLSRELRIFDFEFKFKGKLSIYLIVLYSLLMPSSLYQHRVVLNRELLKFRLVRHICKILMKNMKEKHIHTMYAKTILESQRSPLPGSEGSNKLLTSGSTFT